MTLNEHQRGHLVTFAVREAGDRGSLEQMRAIALCIRNRVRAGWHDGSWMEVIEAADSCSAHEAGQIRIDPNNRNYQRLLNDIDNIFFAQQRHELDGTGGGSPTMEQAIVEHEVKYWCFLNRPMRDWFKEKIVQDPASHPNRVQMGLMMFFE